MAEFDLEQWLETTTETEDFELDTWLTKTTPEEDDRPWWQRGWEKTKDIYEWMYPRGIEDLPRQYGAALTEAGMKVGEGATWLARLAPEQEDLAPWEEQDIPRQALTLAQATSLIALGSLIGYTGISAIGSLAKNLAYGRADKIAERFAVQNIDKIKQLNPQVKTLDDATALAQASLRGVVAPTVETTYLPTTMAKLSKLGQELLRPLAKTAPTTQFKAQLTGQVTTLLKQLTNKVPSEELMLPFIQTIEHHVGNPATGMITAEYGQAVAAIISGKVLPMFEQIRQVGKAVPAIDIPKKPPITVTEEVTTEEPLVSGFKPMGMEYLEGQTVADVAVNKAIWTDAKEAGYEDIFALKDKAIVDLTEKELETLSTWAESWGLTTGTRSAARKLDVAIVDIKTARGLYEKPDVGVEPVTKLPPEAKAPPKEEIPEDLTLAMKDITTGEITEGIEGEFIHIDMMERLGARYEEMEPGWVGAEGKFYGVFDVRRKLAGAELIKEPKGLIKVRREWEEAAMAEVTAEEKTIFQTVKKMGGVKNTPVIKDYGSYSEIPLGVRDKEGKSLDELAGEMGIETDTLWRAITEAPKEPAPLPVREIPAYMEQEINMGGGPALGMGLELTSKKAGESIFVEPEVKGALSQAVDWTTKTFSVYSKVKKEFPEAYQMFREFKGGQELALINAKEENEKIWGRIRQEDALAVQRYRQNPEKYPLESLSEELKPVAQKLDKTMEDSLAEFVSMGKLKVGWPESYIGLLDKEKEKLLAEIPLLKQAKAIQKRQDRIKEVDELVEVLKTRRFFPGRYYNTPEGQSALLKFIPEGRFRKSQIRETWIKGKTITDIDEAIKAGLQPVDPRAATMDYLAWKEIEKNKWVLYQGLKSNPNLVMKERNAPEWWDDATGLKELKGYKINPIVSDVLREFEWTDPKGNLEQAYWKVARVGKIASFYNPLIMGGIYDPQQGYAAAGIRIANPLLMARSVKSALIKDDFYKMCVGADLFPKPVDLGPQKGMEELSSSVARQMDIETPRFTQLIEQWTDGKWDFKDQTNTEKIIKTFKGFYSGLWNTTWMLDAASRMNTVKVLLARGWDFTKAVERARFYHADYGDIPAGTRRFANYFMWTPSYQASMAKVYGNMVRHPLKEKGPISRTIAFQIILAAGAAMLGYKWQRGNRFVKSISKTEEDVITNPGPLYWLNKQLVRLGTNPGALVYYQSSVPLNIVLSIMTNYDGLGGRVFDPKASEVVQAAQTTEFIVKRYFRPLEAAGRLKDEERPVFDRMLQLIAITKYQRTKRKPKKKKTPVGWHWR